MEFDKAFFDAGLERRHTDCVKWDGMDDEQLAALKARIEAAEAARAEKTKEETSSDENAEG